MSLLLPDFYRCSALNTLASCPGLFVMQQADSTSGKAADTGSMVGRLIELFHEHLAQAPSVTDLSLNAARMLATKQALKERPTSWPLADVDAAGKAAARYTEDPRAYSPTSEFGVVLPEYSEAEVRLTLEPDPSDLSGLPIKLVGHVDQIRAKDGFLSVWDVKNGKAHAGVSALYAHCWQLSAYVVAATETLGQPVYPGGLILTQGYFGKIKSKRPAGDCGGVWVSAPWSIDDCRHMLRQVAYQIAQVRNGLIAEIPGPQCTYCPGQGPSNCGQSIDDLLGETS